MFEWFGVSFAGEDSVSAKQFLDMKFLTQSNLKLDKEGQLVVVEVSPPPAQSVNVVDLGISTQEIHDYMEELRANHKQLMDGQKQLSEQLHDLGRQTRFWNKMVYGDKFGESYEKCSSGNTNSLLHELCKKMYGSSGSSDVKFTFSTGTEEDSPDRPRTALDALKEAEAAGKVDLEARKDEIAAKMDAAKDDDEF